MDNQIGNQIKDKYNQAKSKVKGVATNKTYMSNIFLAIAAVFLLLISASTFGFTDDIFSWNWFLVIAMEAVSMAMFLISISSTRIEKQKKTPEFKLTLKSLGGKVYCCNENRHLGTGNGMVNVVNLFNKDLCETKWRIKLRAAIGSLYGSELDKLNDNFDSFETDFTNEWWNKFFDDRNFKKSKRKKAMKVIEKIRNNEFRVRGIICADAITFDTYNGKEKISPVYKPFKDYLKGITMRIMTVVAFAMMLGSIFLQNSPDAAGWVYAVVTRAFLITTTIFMAFSLGNIVFIKTRNAVFKRIEMLEDAFNYCNLPKATRAKYYPVQGEPLPAEFTKDTL